MLAQDPEKQKLAWEYLKLASSAFGSATVVKNSGYMPVNQLAVTDPQYLGDFYRQNPNYQIAASQLPALGPWYAFPGENSVKINEVIFNNLMAAMTGKATPEEAMKVARMEGTRSAEIDRAGTARRGGAGPVPPFVRRHGAGARSLPDRGTDVPIGPGIGSDIARVGESARPPRTRREHSRRPAPG